MEQPINNIFIDKLFLNNLILTENIQNYLFRQSYDEILTKLNKAKIHTVFCERNIAYNKKRD